MPKANVRLEYRPRINKRLYFDLQVTTETENLALELKYLTRRVSVTIGDEAFDLADQSAQDIRRYDFWEDVVRLERLVQCADCHLVE